MLRKYQFPITNALGITQQFSAKKKKSWNHHFLFRILKLSTFALLPEGYGIRLYWDWCFSRRNLVEVPTGRCWGSLSPQVSWPLKKKRKSPHSFVFDMARLYKSWHPGLKKKRAWEMPSGEKMLYVKQCLEYITLCKQSILLKIRHKYTARDKKWT